MGEFLGQGGSRFEYEMLVKYQLKGQALPWSFQLGKHLLVILSRYWRILRAAFPNSAEEDTQRAGECQQTPKAVCSQINRPLAYSYYHF